MEIENNKVVSINYIGTLEDGEEFDNSHKRGEPLTFTVGSNSIIVGLEKELIGLKVGDKKKINVLANDAYGEHRKELIQKVEKDKLPKDIQTKVGTVLALKHPVNNQTIPAKIVEEDEKEIVLDINHPLSGKNLIFDIEVVDIKENSSKEKKCGCGECRCSSKKDKSKDK